MADIAKLGEELLGLTILEAKELNDFLEERGIKAAAAVAVAGPAAGGDAGGGRRGRLGGERKQHQRRERHQDPGPRPHRGERRSMRRTR